MVGSGVCGICGKKVNAIHYHHITYQDVPEKVPFTKREQQLTGKKYYWENGHRSIEVCSSCHSKIHHSKDKKFAKYRPYEQMQLTDKETQQKRG